MDFLRNIMDNPYYAALLVAVVLIASELLLWKRQMHYNRNDDQRMASSILNRKYHLDKKKNVDLAYINKTLALYNIGAILFAAVIMVFNLIIGFVTYTLLTIAVNYYASAQIAKKYENSK